MSFEVGSGLKGGRSEVLREKFSLKESGMQDPVTSKALEALRGLVRVFAECLSIL